MTLHCNLPTKHERCVSQGNVETLFRGGGKHLYYVMSNLIRIIYTKLFQNWRRFAENMTKTFWCVFGSQF